MAKIYEGSNDEDFPLSPYGHSAFLTSIRDFENAEGEKWNECGITLGVEKVGNLFTTNNKKAQMVVELVVLEDMPKVRQHVVAKDKDGNPLKNKAGKQYHVKEIDDLTGDERKKIVIGEIKKEDLITIPFFFNCGNPKSFENNTELIFFNKSSAYPLFKYALIKDGQLPEDMGDKPFTTTQEELSDALEGLRFKAKCQTIKGKDSTYNRLIVEDED